MSEVLKYLSCDNFEDIYIAILKALNDNPEFKANPRGIGSREITNLAFELTNPRDRYVWNKAREVDYVFATKFWLWMINGDTDFSYVFSSNKNAANFIDKPKDEKAMPTNFSTAYGPRILKQMPYIVDELVRDHSSRRAVIHILDKDDLNMLGTDTKEEYPCSMTFTFMIRDDALHMYSGMRSNNCVLTICFDIFNMTMLQEYLYRVLKKTYPNLKLGSYHHTMVSAHYFDREQPLVDKILAANENGDVGMIQKK